ncbi:hypothetical protein [uncultured Methylobacterium sp.]|uniref:hypothetical protein n=1 Tax=uncultured Methylobacterium sp. TaxID=157278 RepID=UPI0035CC8ABB
MTDPAPRSRARDRGTLSLAQVEAVDGLTGRAAPVSVLALGAFFLLLGAGRHAMRGLILRGPAAGLPHPIGAR